MSATVLVIDDEANIRRMLASMLHAAGHRVIGAADGRAGLVELENDEADVVLLDLLLPGDDGTDRSAAASSSGTPVCPWS